MFPKNKTDIWPTSIKVAVFAVILIILWIFNFTYITPLLLGIIAAILSYPIFHILNSKLRFKKFTIPQTVSALFTIIGVSFVIGFILNRFVVEIVRESPSFISQISDYVSSLPSDKNIQSLIIEYKIDPETVNTLAQSINKGLKSLLSVFGREVNTEGQLLTLKKEDIDTALRFGSQSVKNLANYLIVTVIFVLSWYNSLKQGKSWINGVFALLPFNEKEEKRIKTDLKDGVQNVVYANIVSGGIHAIVCFALMLFFGIPNVFILTIIVFLIGFLPLSPSEVGYAIPLSLIAMQTGNIFLIIILAILAEILILWVNYVLIPSIISSKQEGNDLLILTSILSGIAIFGLMGFIIGPVIMILVQTLYRILIERLDDERS
jgi:predicted PurR-regulated permease PerM